MKYGVNKEKLINSLKRVSKPSRRVYMGKDKMPKIKSGLGVLVVSTSKGIMTSQKARELNIGGEIICEIW